MPTNIKYRTADGATQVVGSTEDLGQVVSLVSADVETTPIKMCLENVSDRALGAASFSAFVLRHEAVGSNDGVDYIFAAEDVNGTLSKPWGAGVDDVGVLNGAPVASLGVGAGGGWAAAGGVGEYGVVVTALNATGETIASVEVAVTVAALTDEWLVD